MSHVRKKTLVSLRPILASIHARAMDRYDDHVMDYLTPRKLFQLLEVYIADDLARRMAWAKHHVENLPERTLDVFGSAPWHKKDTVLLHDIETHVYEPMYEILVRFLDDLGVPEGTMDVWHPMITTRGSNEYLIVNEGDYRIYVWNKLHQNDRRTGGLHWTFDQGIMGFGITEAWRLTHYHGPGDAGGDRLDR